MCVQAFESFSTPKQQDKKNILTKKEFFYSNTSYKRDREAYIFFLSVLKKRNSYKIPRVANFIIKII